MIRRIIKSDYFLSVLSKVCAIIIGLLSSSFLTRFLGIEYKGEFAFITNAVNVAALVLNLGVYQSYTYYFRQRGNTIFNEYFSISVYQFFLYLIVSITLSFFVKDLSWIFIFLMTPFQVLRLQMDNIMLVQNIRGKLKTNILSSLLLLSFYVVLFFFFNSGILPVVVSIVVSELFIVGNYLFYERKQLRLKQIDRAFTKDVLKFGFLPMISALLVTLNYSIDIFFLKRIGISSELSIYSVAAGIMNYVWLVPDAFKDIVFSRVARNNQKASVAFSTKCSLLFLIISTLGFLALGKVFIHLMYGEDFAGAYGVTLVLFLGVFSMIFFKIFGIVLIAEGKRIPFFIMLLISVVLNVVLNYFLIPIFGMYGAAWASVGSYNLCGILFLIYYSRSHNTPIKQLLIINKEEINSVKQLLHKGKKETNS